MARLYNPDTNEFYDNQTYFDNRAAWESAGYSGRDINSESLSQLAGSGVLGRNSSGDIVRNLVGGSLSSGGSGGTGGYYPGLTGPGLNTNIPTQVPVYAPQAPVTRIPTIQTQPNAPQNIPQTAARPRVAPTAIPVNNINSIGAMPSWLEFSSEFGLPAPGPRDVAKDESRLPQSSGLDFRPDESAASTQSQSINIYEERNVPSPRPRPDHDPYSRGQTIATVPTVSQTQATRDVPLPRPRPNDWTWESAGSLTPLGNSRVTQQALLPTLPRSTLMNAVWRDAAPAGRVTPSYVSSTALAPLQSTQSASQNQFSRISTLAGLNTPMPTRMPESIRQIREAPRPPADIPNPVTGLLDFISQTEGTNESMGYRGYNETLGYGAYTGGPVELTKMSLNEVRDLQRGMLRHPNNTWNSSAVGRYQIVGTTLQGLMEELNLTGEERFDEAMQDRLATTLLERRGLSDYRSGALDEDTFLDNLSSEWASLPNALGVGTYKDQRIGASGDETRSILGLLRNF